MINPNHDSTELGHERLRLAEPGWSGWRVRCLVHGILGPFADRSEADACHEHHQDCAQREPVTPATADLWHAAAAPSPASEWRQRCIVMAEHIERAHDHLVRAGGVTRGRVHDEHMRAGLAELARATSADLPLFEVATDLAAASWHRVVADLDGFLSDPASREEVVPAREIRDQITVLRRRHVIEPIREHYGVRILAARSAASTATGSAS